MPKRMTGFELYYFYPHRKALHFHVLYIATATIASLVYEWLAMQAGFFSYQSWKLVYSAICYPDILIILAAHFAFTRSKINHDFSSQH
uniref:Uncharacterized protein n=1 Tax=Cohnella candidum TaxID=2674991 RepID=A0A3G3JX54_9BACL|nr:hypothetical protein EAV92_07520 [Cohnella candidum]